MRGILPWLLVLGVIAGLWGRVLGVDHVHSEPKGSKHECCDHHHHDDGDKKAATDKDGGGDSHCPDCPPYPHEHHTHACCHQLPLAGVELAAPRLLTLDVSRTTVDWQRAARPDEPVFALDKPPLI